MTVEVSGMVYNLFYGSLYKCDLTAEISPYESWRPVQGRMANKAQSWSKYIDVGNFEFCPHDALVSLPSTA